MVGLILQRFQWWMNQWCEFPLEFPVVDKPVVGATKGVTVEVLVVGELVVAVPVIVNKPVVEIITSGGETSGGSSH